MTFYGLYMIHLFIITINWHRKHTLTFANISWIYRICPLRQSIARACVEALLHNSSKLYYFYQSCKQSHRMDGGKCLWKRLCKRTFKLSRGTQLTSSVLGLSAAARAGVFLRFFGQDIWPTFAPAPLLQSPSDWLNWIKMTPIIGSSCGPRSSSDPYLTPLLLASLAALC